jgi:hypothetical protein
MSVKTLDMLLARLKPLAIPKMALAIAPPRKTGSAAGSRSLRSTGSSRRRCAR